MFFQTEKIRWLFVEIRRELIKSRRIFMKSRRIVKSNEYRLQFS